MHEIFKKSFLNDVQQDKEKILDRYKLMLKKPHLSDNIYMELTLPNLKKFY